MRGVQFQPSNEMKDMLENWNHSGFSHRTQLHLIPSDFIAGKCKEHLLGHDCSIQSTLLFKYLQIWCCCFLLHLFFLFFFLRPLLPWGHCSLFCNRSNKVYLYSTYPNKYYSRLAIKKTTYPHTQIKPAIHIINRTNHNRKVWKCKTAISINTKNE